MLGAGEDGARSIYLSSSGRKGLTTKVCGCAGLVFVCVCVWIQHIQNYKRKYKSTCKFGIEYAICTCEDTCLANVNVRVVCIGVRTLVADEACVCGLLAETHLKVGLGFKD